MAPLTTQERQELLNQPGVTTELLDEYERLISEFFMFDPDMITAGEELTRYQRIEELHGIIHPGKKLSLSPIESADEK
jgi:hypothetical protein